MLYMPSSRRYAKRKKFADNHDSKDKLSSEASVTKNPYYPYNQELFGHDEEGTLDFAEDCFSPICLACTTAKMLQCLPPVKFPLLYYLPPQIILLLKIPHDYSHLMVTFGTIWLFGLKTQTMLLPC